MIQNPLPTLKNWAGKTLIQLDFNQNIVFCACRQEQIQFFRQQDSMWQRGLKSGFLNTKTHCRERIRTKPTWFSQLKQFWYVDWAEKNAQTVRTRIQLLVVNNCFFFLLISVFLNAILLNVAKPIGLLLRIWSRHIIHGNVAPQVNWEQQRD